MQPAQKIMRGSQPTQNTGTPRAQSTKKIFAAPGFSSTGSSARTFVSAANGVDTNNCGHATPCRTFQRAVDQTGVGGEVVVLDAGGYGTFTAGQSVSVNGGGFYAGISVTDGSASTTTGVTVSAGSGVVSLIGLSIHFDGTSGVSFGIDFQTGAALHIEKTDIDGFERGINVQGDFSCLSPGGTALLNISNSIVRNSTSDGIFLGVGGGVLSTSIDATTVKNTAFFGVDNTASNGAGSCSGSAQANTTISNSVITGAGSDGISNDSGTSQLTVYHSVISSNLVGLQNLGSCNQALLSEVLVTNNGNGVSGNFGSFGNNNVGGNNNDSGGTVDTGCGSFNTGVAPVTPNTSKVRH